MSRSVMSTLRHPNERTYGSIMIVAGTVLWGIFVLIMLGLLRDKPAQFATTLFYIVAFVVFSLLSAAFYRAHIYGHYVLVGPGQFPALHRMVTEQAEILGLVPAPKTFVYNSNGLVNAFARRLLGGRYIFLTSALLEMDTDPQVQFVIGHELGHHAAGHLSWGKNVLKAPAHLVPFLAQAYSRARELTCDRVGAHLAGDPAACRSALQMLACGCARLNASMNADEFAAQERLVPPFFGWLSLIFARYPRTTQRVIAVTDFLRGRQESAF